MKTNHTISSRAGSLLTSGAIPFAFAVVAAVVQLPLVAGELAASERGFPEPPANEVRLVESIPVPPQPPPPLPPLSEPPSTLVRKVFESKLLPEDLAKLKLPSTPFPAQLPPLGLSRLGSEVPQAKFDLDLLETESIDNHAHRQTQRGIVYIDVDGGKKWMRPLRDARDGVLFISLLADAGIGSTFDLGGALLRVVESPETQFAEIEIGEAEDSRQIEWRPLGYRVPLENFDGRSMAQLPLLTARLNLDKEKWDVFSGYVRVATGLPLGARDKGARRQFAVEAGPAGVWISGLLSSEENPLVADVNRDGVDDGLEWLAEEAVKIGRDKVTEPKPSPVQWVPVLQLVRPLPDRVMQGKVSAD